MDFPVNLESAQWVYGKEELKQNVIVLLKDPLGSFIQSNSVGSHINIHNSSFETLELDVKQTLNQIPYIEVVSVSATVDIININIVYNGEVIKFQYSLEV